MDVMKALVSGMVVFGLATTIGLHGGGIDAAAKGVGGATQGVLGTAIKG